MHGTAHGPMKKNIHKCIILTREQVVLHSTDAREMFLYIENKKNY